MKRKIRIGARGSLLARRQAQWVAQALESRNAQIETEVVAISTAGDRSQEPIGPGHPIQGVFVKEIQEALLQNRIDIAVHSMKDLPSETSPELEIAAVPKREDFRDALLGKRWKGLAHGARVGTSSPRRIAQLLFHRPDLQVLPMRGNVDTRIRKLKEGRYDAIVLACAGLIRLGLEKEIAESFDPAVMLPAPGQGALAIEIRKGDEAARSLCRDLHDETSGLETQAERGLLQFLKAGCSVPLAALAQIRGGRLFLTGVLASPDGKRLVREEESGDPDDLSIAQRLGAKLLSASIP